MAENIFYDAQGKQIDINGLSQGSRLYNKDGQEINSEGGVVIRDVLGNVLNPIDNQKKEPIKILGKDGNAIGETVKVSPLVDKLGQEIGGTPEKVTLLNNLGQEIDAKGEVKSEEKLELVDKEGRKLDSDGKPVVEPVTLVDKNGAELDAEGNPKPVDAPKIEIVERNAPRESTNVTALAEEKAAQEQEDARKAQLEAEAKAMEEAKNIAGSAQENEDGFEIDETKNSSKEKEPEHYADSMSDMQSEFTDEAPEKMSLEDIERFWRGWNEEKKDISQIAIADNVVNVEFNSGTKIKDSGDKISMEAGKGQDLPPDEDFAKMMEAADQRGWRAIKFGPNCSPEFAAKLYLACAKAGMKPIGYEPSPELKAKAMEIAKENGFESWGTENYKRPNQEEKEPTLLEDRTTQSIAKFGSFGTKYVRDSQDALELKAAGVYRDTCDSQFEEWKSRVGKEDLSDAEKVAIDKYRVAEKDKLGKDEQIDFNDLDEKHVKGLYDNVAPAKSEHLMRYYAAEKAKMFLSQKKCENADAVADSFSAEEFSALADKMYKADKRSAIMNDVANKLSSNQSLSEEQLSAKLEQAQKDVSAGKLDGMTPSESAVSKNIENSKMIIHKGEMSVNKLLDSGNYSGKGQTYNPEQVALKPQTQTQVKTPEGKDGEKGSDDNNKPNVIIQKRDGSIR